MDEGLIETCESCGKRFRIRSDQMDHDVQCPHCNAVITPIALAETPGDIFDGPLPPAPRRVPSRLPYKVMLAKSGGRKYTFAIVWIIFLVLAAGGLAVLVKFKLEERDLQKAAPPPVKAPVAIAVQTPLFTPAPDKTTTAAASSKTVHKIEEKSGAAAAADAAKAAKDAAADDVLVDGSVDVGVFKLHNPGERLGLAGGKLVNHTGKVIKVLRIVSPINSKDGKEIGKATAVILNIPRGATIPFVAEWVHGEGEFGVLARGGATYSIADASDPLGGLPEVVAERGVAIPDLSSEMTSTGDIHLSVTNKGQTELRDIEVSAILLDEKNNVIAAAKGRVVLPKGTTAIKPGETTECSIPWTNCATSLVKSVEVWAQPTIK
jgi:hypothetical protein